MMRMDGREIGRPRGAVLGPLGLLLAAVMSAFGLWHALTNDRVSAGDERLSHLQSRAGHSHAR
jgi:hypothetical protein